MKRANVALGREVAHEPGIKKNETIWKELAVEIYHSRINGS